jgi:hypothetical protein
VTLLFCSIAHVCKGRYSGVAFLSEPMRHIVQGGQPTIVGLATLGNAKEIGLTVFVILTLGSHTYILTLATFE